MSRLVPEHESFKPATDYADRRLNIAFNARRARLDGVILNLPDREFDLLATLAANEGKPVSRRALLTRLWGYPVDLRSRTLDVHIRRLRVRLNDEQGLHLETVFKVGYRFRRLGEPVVGTQSQPSPPVDEDGAQATVAKPMASAVSQAMAVAL